MIKLILIFVALLFFINEIHAQQNDSIRKKEIGIRLAGLNEFDIIYKKQKKENKYFRVRSFAANIFISQLGRTLGGFSFGMAAGREKRFSINDKFKFVRGWEFGCVLNAIVFGEFDGYVLLSPSIGYIIGFQYELNRDFSINLEMIPSITASIITNSDIILNNQINLSSSGAGLSLLYKF